MKLNEGTKTFKMETSKQNIRDFLISNLDKEILILTKSNLHYRIKGFDVFEDSICFLDKYGDEVVLAISEIAQITKKWK